MYVVVKAAADTGQKPVDALWHLERLVQDGFGRCGCPLKILRDREAHPLGGRLQVAAPSR